MRELGAGTQLCSSMLGVSPSTVRRLARPAHARTRPSRDLDETACRRVREIVRDTHGLVGASNLGRMTGLPRRACAMIKRRELREMEIERKARCATVSIAAPGIVRGFDAMYVSATDGDAYWLVAADASVPYRTSIITVPIYDADHVIDALWRDFETQGPPLVLRLDRIASQRTPDVRRLLAYYQVLPLHGPPRYPRYYGQLERQNREHRDWYKRLPPVSRRELGIAGEAMRTALNTSWPRPTLDGWTAAQAWQRRSRVDVDRRELYTEVTRRVTGLVAAGIEPLRAQREAIETALTDRGLLTINQGGWC
jgi:hypothetical protein